MHVIGDELIVNEKSRIVWCSIQKFTFLRDQKFTTDRAGKSTKSSAQKDHRQVLFLRGFLEDGDISIGMMTANDFGVRSCLERKTL